VPTKRTTEGRPRRAPADTERRRDPERTKERILTAAVEEFAERGYAGARVSRIAARAEVNAQLISYYFDGKAGLYQALNQRWQAASSELTRPASPIEEIAGEFVRANARNRAWGRLLVWEALGDGPGTEADTAPDDEVGDGTGPDQADPLVAQVEDLRRRQAEGEFPADLDAGHLLLALFAMASAPTVLPQIVRRILGAEPDSDEFRAAYAEQVTRMVRHLASRSTSTQPSQ
jgi:AcrR family transcriptional regulator